MNEEDANLPPKSETSDDQGKDSEQFRRILDLKENLFGSDLVPLEERKAQIKATLDDSPLEQLRSDIIRLNKFAKDTYPKDKEDNVAATWQATAQVASAAYYRRLHDLIHKS